MDDPVPVVLCGSRAHLLDMCQAPGARHSGGAGFYTSAVLDWATPCTSSTPLITRRKHQPGQRWRCAGAQGMIGRGHRDNWGVDPVPEALILEFAGLSDADYAAVNGNLGIDMQSGQGDWPPGLLSHAAGQTDQGTFLVTEVWSSRAAQAAFMDSRLGPALGAAGVTVVPDVRWVPLRAYHVPGT